MDKENKKITDIEVNYDKPAEGQEPSSETTKETSQEDSQGEGKQSDKKTLEKIGVEYKAEIKELNDRYLRLAAEFDNYKKRTARQYENIFQTSRENIIAPILEVMDNFERALDAAEKSSDFNSLKEGTKLIYQHLRDLLNKEGVEIIKAVGEKFDPNLHEAMMQVESDEYPEGIIIREMNRGYKINDKVIRYSRVVVSKGGAETKNEEEENKKDR